MCESKTCCNVIAYLNAIGYALGILVVGFLLVTSSIILGEAQKQDSSFKDDSKDAVTLVSAVLVIVSAIEFIRCVAMFVASVFLILGIKRDRHQYIAPWLYMCIVSIVWTALSVFGQPNKSPAIIASTVLGIAIQVACWYPIFALHRRLRKPRYPAQQPEQFPLNTGYNAYPPPSGAYPPGAYAPQAQPAVYNPSTQPMYPNMQNANYPRQTTDAKSDALPEKQ